MDVSPEKDAGKEKRIAYIGVITHEEQIYRIGTNGNRDLLSMILPGQTH